MATDTTLEGIEVVFRLPYRLVLPDGEYPVTPRQHTLHIAHPAVLDYTSAEETGQLDCAGYSVVSMFHEASPTQDTLENELKRCIGITLSATNCLIRWYRFYAQHAQAIELIEEQVSPILLFLSQGQEQYTYIRRYEQSVHSLPPLTSEQLDQLKTDILQRARPPTSHLLVLDAEEAFQQFRHREAVLLSWSAIETSLAPFIRAKLLENLPDVSFDRDSAGENFERDLHFLTSADALLQLLSGFSFRTGVTPEFWEQLRASRGHRNNVIHRGEDADDTQARLAVDVAKVFVQQINQLT